MSHPSLGLPPRDLRAGAPDAAALLTAGRSRIAARALEAAVEIDPTMGDRYDEIGLRALLADLGAFIDRLAMAVGAADPAVMANFAEMVAVRYRKRAVPMDDVATLMEGLRRSAAAALPPSGGEAVNPGIDEAIRVLKWHRRLAGDARKRNALVAFIYRGA